MTYLFKASFLLGLMLIGADLSARDKEALKTDVQAPKIAIILNSGSASLTRIDMQKKEVIDEFPIGKEPHHLMLTPDGKNLLVANAASNNLVVVDPSTGNKISVIPKISDPYQLGFSPNKQWFVVAGNRLDRIDIYPVLNGVIGPIQRYLNFQKLQVILHLRAIAKSAL